MDFVTHLITIFAIIDPITLVPIYLTVTGDLDASEKRKVSFQALWIAGIILIANAVIGDAVFRFFGISMPAFQIAGGLLLFALSLQQLLFKSSARRQTKEMELAGSNVSVFPLATPLLAGPGAISTVTLLATRSHTLFDRVSLISCILIVLTIGWIVLKNADRLLRFLGSTGIEVFTKLMAIVLAALAIQFIIDGIKAFWG